MTCPTIINYIIISFYAKDNSKKQVYPWLYVILLLRVSWYISDRRSLLTIVEEGPQALEAQRAYHEDRAHQCWELLHWIGDSNKSIEQPWCSKQAQVHMREDETIEGACQEVPWT